MDDFVEENSPPPAGTGLLINNPWWWAGVLALLVALIGGFALLSEREKRLAREEYDKALADYRAAGLPDPFAAPASLPPVPTEAEGNLLFAPIFDGLAVFRGGSGAYASFSANENAAIRAKVDDVGQFTFGAPGAPFWVFDPAAHFADKRKPSRLVVAPQAGESPTQAFIVPLEREFPALKSLAQIEASHPKAVSPEQRWSALHAFEMPIPEFKSARATGLVLTAYAGCKALEGDGAPAAAAVCGLSRYFEATAANEGGTLVSSLINVIIAKISLPRLTHLAIREGVWSDDQLRRAGEHLGRVRLTDATLASLSREIRSSLSLLKGVAEKEPETLQWKNRFLSGGFGGSTELEAALREPGVWGNAEGLLRFLLNMADSRNADGQIDVAKCVAFHDAVVLQPISESNAFASLSLPAHLKVLANAGLADAQIRSARLACALELHRRAHGAYPAKLEALVPEFLPALPHAPWAGGSLKYALTPAGYTLTWPKADYYDTGLGGVNVDVKHPGPWEILGKEIELPARIRWFDTRTVSHPTVSPKDVVWTMPAPKAR